MVRCMMSNPKLPAEFFNARLAEPVISICAPYFPFGMAFAVFNNLIKSVSVFMGSGDASIQEFAVSWQYDLSKKNKENKQSLPIRAGDCVGAS